MTLPSYAMSQARFPELYERHLTGPLFRPWAEDLLDLAALERGDRVLDVACGTGIVARLAKARLGAGATVVGVDISEGMLAVAREREPSIDWRVGDAAALPVPDSERFDVVACQQGMQFFSDRDSAAREMRRVLAAGGRAVVATWRPIEESEFYLDMQRAAEPLVGTYVDPRLAWGDVGELASVLEAAGFSDVSVATRSRRLTFDDPGSFVQMNAMAIVGLSGAGEKRSDRDRLELVDAIVDKSRVAIGRYIRDGRLSYESASNVAIARAG